VDTVLDVVLPKLDQPEFPSAVSAEYLSFFPISTSTVHEDTHNQSLEPVGGNSTTDIGPIWLPAATCPSLCCTAANL
jgi:hypothetical protein